MKRVLSLIVISVLALSSLYLPMQSEAETSQDVIDSAGFNLICSDTSLWKTGGWSGINAVKDGTLSVTNGWAHYGGFCASSQSFTFSFNTTAESGALQIYFRNAVKKEEILSGNNDTTVAGNPFMLTYSAKSGQIYFSEYTDKTGTQLRNKSDTAYSGGECAGLNDGNDHIITIETSETDITELKLYVDGVYLFSSYWHGGVKEAGYISFVTYAKNTFNISALYIDGIGMDPYLIGQETEYVSFGFESGVTAKYPNGESDTVYAEGISAAAHTGEKGLHIVKEAGSNCWFYVALSDSGTAPLKSGNTYRASMYIKTNPDAAASGQTTFNFYSGADAGSTSFKGNPVASENVSNWGIDKGYADYLDKAKDRDDGGWTKLMISSEFTVQEGYPYIVLVLWAEESTAFNWYIDDVEFCEITQISVNKGNSSGGSFTVDKVDNIYSLGLGAEGEIEVTDGDLAYGDTIALTAYALDGYCLEGWYLNGEKIIGAGDIYSFKLTANTEISAKFEQGYNILRAPAENWVLNGAADISDTLNIYDGGEVLLNSVLLSTNTLKLRFTPEASQNELQVGIKGNEAEYSVVASGGVVSLIKYSDDEEILTSASAGFEDSTAEYEMHLGITSAETGTNISLMLGERLLINFTDTNIQDFSGLFKASGNGISFTYIGVEELINTEFEMISNIKQKIDKCVSINIGSTFLDDLNKEYKALKTSLSKMLPNTHVLEKANAAYNEFIDANLPSEGLVEIYNFCGIRQRDGGVITLSFKSDEKKNYCFKQAGFVRLENGAVVLPSYLLGDSQLYADTADSETVSFADSGYDISHYNVSIGGWTSRSRRNTELSFRGYSVYEKNGIKLLVYSDTHKTSVYQAAVNQYNIIKCEKLEASVFNGESALLYLSGDIENQVIDVNITDIKQNIKTLGRTSYSDTALLIDRALAGFAFSGRFKGDVSAAVDVQLNNVGGMYLYIVVDGDYDNANRINIDSSGEYVLASFDKAGDHEIEVIKATEGGLAKLDVKSLSVMGTLYDAPAAKGLSVEFLGDSITSGWGVYTYEELKTEDQSFISDAFLNYASRTAQTLDADVSVISRSGIRTEQLFEEQYPYIHDRNKEVWNYTSHPDIIVVNLGQNDVKTYQNDQDSFAKIVAQKIAYLRALHPDAAIIWVNGMMSTTMMSAIEQAVKAFDDSLVFSLCLPTNTEGQLSHPSIVGHANAATVLTEYIEKSVIPVLKTIK